MPDNNLDHATPAELNRAGDKILLDHGFDINGEAIPTGTDKTVKKQEKFFQRRFEHSFVRCGFRGRSRRAS